ncbi:MAG: hypothetical protein PHT07_24410 [Paludibacter sp.]|nr:hypothetical protein [Paludibacter sp.]
MKKIRFDEPKFSTEIIDMWDIENFKNEMVETVKAGKIFLNKMQMVKFLDTKGITEISVEDAKIFFIAEYEEQPKPKMEYGTPDGYIDADGDLIKITKTETPKSTESSKIDAGFIDDLMEEGFEQACENAGFSKFEMVGIETAKVVETEIETSEEIETITVKGDIALEVFDTISKWTGTNYSSVCEFEQFPSEIKFSRLACYTDIDGKETVIGWHCASHFQSICDYVEVEYPSRIGADILLKCWLVQPSKRRL